MDCLPKYAASPLMNKPTVSIRDLTEHHEALQRTREREATADFKAEYTKRAGIGGTVSRAVRTCGVRRSKYVGLTRPIYTIS